MNISLVAALPEIFLSVMILVMLILDVSIKNKKFGGIFSILALLGALIIQLMIEIPGKTQSAFNGMFVLDNLAFGMKLFTYIFAILIVLYTKQYIMDKKLPKTEFYAIYLFAILGILTMISADNLLILYVGLELLSLALYTLVAIDRDNVKSTEAAMKFFILGALASGLLLYGISFIYGATNGQLQLEVVGQSVLELVEQNVNDPTLVFGLVFIVAGLAFKLGLVPFHMWIPDTYEGAGLATTTIIATVTKIAAVVFMVRFLISGLVGLGSQWSIMLSFLAFLSLFIGNIVAIAQTNIKRMLGYSTIANMSFIAFGFMTLSVDGVSSAIFYIVVYVLTALAGFGVLLLLSRDSYECESIHDLKGLSKSHPIYAAVMLLVMFSLAGIPPLIGFYAKFKILQALVAGGFIRSAIFAVIMSLIGAFYYLRVVKIMYFEESSTGLLLANNDKFSRFVLVLNGFSLLLLGVVPAWFMSYCLHLITG